MRAGRFRRRRYAPVLPSLRTPLPASDPRPGRVRLPILSHTEENVARRLGARERGDATSACAWSGLVRQSSCSEVMLRDEAGEQLCGVALNP